METTKYFVVGVLSFVVGLFIGSGYLKQPEPVKTLEEIKASGYERCINNGVVNGRDVSKCESIRL